ncbi:methylenetetrahydrofolate--tRNA-(uracil(54)-C(5))-methyltransferase (FADH(2)-oxidizing) TrmFO [uncultured Cohaesibacter sp.]|uniref:methylenetetrahydrofolate--tRNA-(uracil(54)- C(5))-methyltransferase (FADH(2)-oxidizing) TrmFO n=1 Tax=uncultured Cohaesibacter sp. TaxID=1002546 RepID=UPI00292DE944|nr:methylenetetrahydrofolate--tRNA-(uracil(54)-C(5))-methyltransferase (FADH(2)-oxidizing) TrmFO [uncultured Cohaesibacter sp.]
MSETAKTVCVIGAGLAGSEAAWQLASSGVSVKLVEMRPIRSTDAHVSDHCAELVCSNSFRSDDHQANAVGVLHQEMREANSLIMACADSNAIPAGGALAVAREAFSEAVTEKLSAHPLIEIVRNEIDAIPGAEDGPCLVATGPLTSEALSQSILAATGEEALSFYDAIAPIVHFDSIDMSKAWFQSRYDKKGPSGTGADYINCAMNEEEYRAFIGAMLGADKAEFKEWEKAAYFDGCLPIEVMAERGFDTPRYGPMKPVGLTNPHKPDEDPFAVVQLRQDNKLGTLFNIVGFQTKMKHGAQAEVFRMIPGLETAQFARLGGIHRNTFLNSPKLLDGSLRLKSLPHVRFAGQITGCEGYVESSAIGLLAGRFLAAEVLGKMAVPPPETTAFGALLGHITGGHLIDSNGGRRSFQPMNVNFGLFPPVDFPRKREDGSRMRGVEKQLSKKKALAKRAISDTKNWLAENPL